MTTLLLRCVRVSLVIGDQHVRDEATAALREAAGRKQDLAVFRTLATTPA